MNTWLEGNFLYLNPNSLKQSRKYNNKSLKDLSKITGFSVKFISDVEHGRKFAVGKVGLVLHRACWRKK